MFNSKLFVCQRATMMWTHWFGARGLLAICDSFELPHSNHASRCFLYLQARDFILESNMAMPEFPELNRGFLRRENHRTSSRAFSSNVGLQRGHDYCMFPLHPNPTIKIPQEISPSNHGFSMFLSLPLFKVFQRPVPQCRWGKRLEEMPVLTAFARASYPAERAAQGFSDRQAVKLVERC